ncbi:MAG: hypothetical protein PHG77_04950 [Proteiniphilum sp.]|jgi:hypothetical protein|nr:hypothetical protein [Proteiniphilum sp.]
MQKKHIICLLISWGILLSLQVGASEPEKRYRIIHNNDGSDALGNYWFQKRPLTVNDVNAYVDMVSHSQVNTYMMCTGSDFFYYRSKHGRILGDDLDGKLNCGNDTAATNHYKSFYQNHLNLEKEGTDLIEASLKRAKMHGMEAFITYRMNDLHFNDTTLNCPITYSEFWYAHPAYWTNDDTPGLNGSRALDFAHPEVRAHKLAIITEQLEKYEMIDGLDLDFMRFIVYFKQGEGKKNAHLMTELLQEVKAKVDQLSKKRRKKILLSVRVPLTVQDCLDKGLDIQEWIRLGLVDFITIGVHWRGNPSLPVAQFIKELGSKTVPVYATIDDGGYKPRETFSHGMFRGMASHILSQGADGIYLFNHYYGAFNSTYQGMLHLEKGDQVCRVISPNLIQELGSLETLAYKNKIYCLSDGVTEYGIKHISPLPLEVKPGEPSHANIFIGDDPVKTIPEEVILFVRSSKQASFTVKVNGKDITRTAPEYVSPYDRERGLEAGECQYAFVLSGESMQQGYNTVTFHAVDSSFTVKRVEIALKYGDVKTHGYF